MAQSKKKILYLITKATWGGAQRYVFDLAAHLPKPEFEPVVAYGQSGKLSEDLKTAGIETYAIPSLGRDVAIISDIRSFFAILKCIRARKPDVIHLNSSKAAALGALAARLCGVKRIIFTVHGWPFGEQRHVLAKIVIWNISWLTALLSHKVICVSDYDLRIAKRMPFIRGKSVLVHNGIQEITAHAINDDDSKSVVILTIAELTGNKNLFVAIDSVAKAREMGARIMQYVIIGAGEGKDSLKKYIAEHGYEKFVSLGGQVPYEDLFLKNFDIFFLPSSKEGLPYVLLEAGFLHRAVVASSVGGIPEIIDDEKNGILKQPADVTGFATALKRFADNPQLRIEMGRQLEAKVRERFSLNRMIVQTTTLY